MKYFVNELENDELRPLRLRPRSFLTFFVLEDVDVDVEDDDEEDIAVVLPSLVVVLTDSIKLTVHEANNFSPF